MSTRCIATKALSGNTISLTFQFRNWHDEIINVNNINFKVFDINNDILFESIITNDVEEIDSGTYNYQYTTPDNHDSIIIEVSTIYEEKPLLIRRGIRLIKSRN